VQETCKSDKSETHISYVEQGSVFEEPANVQGRKEAWLYLQQSWQKKKNYSLPK